MGLRLRLRNWIIDAESLGLLSKRRDWRRRRRNCDLCKNISSICSGNVVLVHEEFNILASLGYDVGQKGIGIDAGDHDSSN